MESFWSVIGWFALIVFVVTFLIMLAGGKKLLKYGARLNREEAERKLPEGAVPALITHIIPYAERGYDGRLTVKAIVDGVEDYKILPADAPNLPESLQWAVGKKSEPAPAGFSSHKDDEGYHVLTQPIDAYYHDTCIVFAPRTETVATS